MQLEDYFEFEKFETKFGVVDRIRLKGTPCRWRLWSKIS